MQALNLYKAKLTLKGWQFGETNIFYNFKLSKFMKNVIFYILIVLLLFVAIVFIENEESTNALIMLVCMWYIYITKIHKKEEEK